MATISSPDSQPDIVTPARSQEVKPLFSGDKERYVKQMFAGIASRYDLLNSVLSFNQHKAWRRRAVRIAGVSARELCLDVCTGTGDFAIDLAAATGAGGRVIAADFCEPMVRNGLRKAASAVGGTVNMMVANAERLPYASSAFDVCTVGFGIRNVAHIDRAIAEMVRVVRPAGRVVVLEFNRPRPIWYRPFIDFYLFHVLPRIGGLFSRQEAYTYLPESMKQFVTREQLAAIMERSGLQDIHVYDLNLGTVCIHIGVKAGD